jgi:hypothetical protein
MGVNYGAGNRQSHAHAALFGRKERLEDLLQDVRPDPRTRIRNQEWYHRRTLFCSSCVGSRPRIHTDRSTFSATDVETCGRVRAQASLASGLFALRHRNDRRRERIRLSVHNPTYDFVRVAVSRAWSSAFDSNGFARYAAQPTC